MTNKLTEPTDQDTRITALGMLVHNPMRVNVEVLEPFYADTLGSITITISLEHYGQVHLYLSTPVAEHLVQELTWVLAGQAVLTRGDDNE